MCLFQTHLPGYLEKAEELKARGVDVIVCVAVNDSFVMDAWGRANGAEGKVCLRSVFTLFLLNYVPVSVVFLIQ